ncbi:MAG: glycosyltransferase family 2 protein [Bacteroidaceae bacterium]
MTTLKWIFWISLFLLFYAYLGYGILLVIIVKIKEFFSKTQSPELPTDEKLPSITLFITAFNEEKIVHSKMKNCQALDYPDDKFEIVWCTDGSNDHTVERLKDYPSVRVLHEDIRAGKTAAMNRGMRFVSSDIVVFTDANTMLNSQAIKEMVRRFEDPKVGCVAGEKRIVEKEKDSAASGGEGIYWRYESKLKELDDRLYSAIGAAGELFSVRRKLFFEMPKDTLLDDFILSMRIAMKGYTIAYTPTAFAEESGSLNMIEEEKRKVRIAAGGLQSIWRLRPLLNIFKYRTLSFQYISHRVLRWSVCPILLFLMIPINCYLAFYPQLNLFYAILLFLQFLFYIMGLSGYLLEKRHLKNKLFFVPYYFLFMNWNCIKGINYLIKQKKQKTGAWEKSLRSES